MIYEAEGGDITIAATGDSIIMRSLSAYREQQFTALLDVLRQADVRFTNLETLIHEFEIPPEAIAGGTFMASHPRHLQELTWAGFNLVSCANNHAYDYGQAGVLTSIGHLEAAALAHAGTGRNLSEARGPGYLETARGRVALISAVSTFNDVARATEQRPDLQGSPGVNPLRHTATYTVDGAAFRELRRMSQELGFEAQKLRRESFGFGGPGPKDTDTEFHFLERKFALGNQFEVHTGVHQGDLEGNLRWIREARRQADWVLVSVHCHEQGPNREDPPEFLSAFAKACIDEGADVFIGHGPHYVKGIEIYKGKPILYSLGHFIFQNESILRQPTENYSRFGLDHYATPSDFYDARGAKDTRGFAADPWYWDTVLVTCEFKKRGLQRLCVYPVELGNRLPRSLRGRPVLAGPEAAQEVLGRMQRMSKPFGTKLEMRDGIGVIEVS